MTTANKPTLTDSEWQQASTALALMRAGHNDVHELRKRLGIGTGKLSQLLSKANQLGLIMWLDGKPYCTTDGLRSCRLITLAESDGNGGVRALT